MSQQIPVDILSDSDSDSKGKSRPFLQNDAVDLTTPPPIPHLKKKLRTEVFSNPSNSTVFIIDDDPTPIKKHTSSEAPASSSTPSFVAETPFSDASVARCSIRKCSSSDLDTDQRVVVDTPMSELLKSEVSNFKCDRGVPNCEPERSLASIRNSLEIKGLICLESDNESEGIAGSGAWKHNETVFAAKLIDSEYDSRSFESSSALKTGTSIESQKKIFLRNADKEQMLDGCSHPSFLEDDISLTCPHIDDADNSEPTDEILSQQDISGCQKKEKTKGDDSKKPKRISKEERLLMMEEKKQQKERDRLLKAASKAEAAEIKKRQKEMQKWEKGKYALKSIVPEIDRKVVELGSIGGHLLTRLAEKGLSYRITSNPVERSIVWTMAIPEEISLTSSERIEVSYVLIIYEAEEFCNLVVNGSLMDHVQSVQLRYPQHTICYLTNRLMAYINKRRVKLLFPILILLYKVLTFNIRTRISSCSAFGTVLNDTSSKSLSLSQTFHMFIGSNKHVCWSSFKYKTACPQCSITEKSFHISWTRRVIYESTCHFELNFETSLIVLLMKPREQAQYKNPGNYTGWKRPAIEEVLSKLATNFFRVHSRQCVDEAELAEHVVGLTCSLATCQFRKKLTRLSVNANGSVVPKDCVDKNLIKKSLWLKALVAIPKVQPRFAIAIWKKYPTMKSLLSVYMDPNKTVHEKEFLLKDLNTEGLLGDDRRLGEVCSKRIYRILMAQSGSIQTDDVENGADFFNNQYA
ncbi:hypothetical protein RD792_008646 [Penstemon davidsonii]|uniref:ERCC4 domain-containing protein n=1 Tax=Penstemon davidsonii TaxID=160366 RepID=A0ABR0DAL0_9LAMI|nr:hypothetical protein RD792_008646 [Penstemon davidsonii]